MSKKQPVRRKKIVKKLTDVEKATNVFQKYLENEAERSGKSVNRVAEEMFKDGFLVWSVEDTEQIAGSSSSGPKTVSQKTLDSLLAEGNR